MKEKFKSIGQIIEMLDANELVIAFAITIALMVHPIIPAMLFMTWLSWKIIQVNFMKDMVNSLWSIIIDIDNINWDICRAAWKEEMNFKFSREIDDYIRSYTISYQEAMHHPMQFTGEAKNSVEFLKKFLNDHPNVKCITKICQDDGCSGCSGC